MMGMTSFTMARIPEKWCFDDVFLSVHHIKEFMISKFILLVMFTLIIWLRCTLPILKLCNFCFSFNFCPLILAFINVVCNNYYCGVCIRIILFPSFLLHLLTGIPTERKSCSFYTLSIQVFTYNSMDWQIFLLFYRSKSSIILIYFVAQIILTLATRRSFRLAPVFFWEAPPPPDLSSELLYFLAPL